MLLSALKRALISSAILVAMVGAGTAHARPLTTKPQLVFDVHVTLTDARIVVDWHSVPRGVTARFLIKNTGTKAHNFTLSGPKTPAGGRQGFSRTLKPGQHESVRVFLDLRARQAYFDALSADRGKAGMRGVVVIR